MQNPWYLAFFVVGVLASSFHLGAGIWNFLCKWGLAATPGRSKRPGGLARWSELHLALLEFSLF